MIRSSACVVVVILSFLVVSVLCSDVRQLTDDNFEHDTQASTGATTGDWLVEFYAPWCGHCKSLAPTWETVATELADRVNVAAVDCTINTATAKRFDIRGFPTIKLLRKGQVYDYQGERTQKALVDFALGGYSSSATRSVPGPPSALSSAFASFDQFGRDVQTVVTQYPIPAVTLATVGLLIGVLIATTMFVFIDNPPTSSPPVRAAAATSSVNKPAAVSGATTATDDADDDADSAPDATTRTSLRERRK